MEIGVMVAVLGTNGSSVVIKQSIIHLNLTNEPLLSSKDYVLQFSRKSTVQESPSFLVKIPTTQVVIYEKSCPTVLVYYSILFGYKDYYKLTQYLVK